MLSTFLFPRNRSASWAGYLFAALACAAAFGLRFMLDPLLLDRSPLILFALAVALSAIRGGFGPGVFATFLGGFLALYFMPPVGTFFSIDQPYRVTAALQLSVFVAVGLILSWLSGELLRLRWQAMQLARQRQEILESITDGFMALDAGWRLVYLNEAAAHAVRIARDGAAGKDVWDQIPDWRNGTVGARLYEAARHRAALRFEYFSSLSNRWFDFHVNSAESGGLTIYFSDVTDHKTADLRLHETLAERDAALANVRLLSGFLPICAGCKKIRDGEGNWEQLESYISNHSQAQFSHGLCPECASKYWDDPR